MAACNVANFNKIILLFLPPMIRYEAFTLDNGLRVIVHEDPTVEIAVMNILYDVGSRDEQPDKTGFAHLFEHLMFGGSANIPSYDEPLQRVGGESNAFTNTDVTNYYLTVPAANIETGFWLESDRMLSLSFDPEVLEVQRKVVIEEFKQNYLNQPYGDVWLKLRPLVYEVHPYQWATIGKDVSHIANATLDQVKDFFYRYYVPSNAILVVAGKVTVPQVRSLTEKWFGPIPSGNPPHRSLPSEPVQQKAKFAEYTADVPAAAFYQAFHMPGRFDDDFYAVDLMSDALGRGPSSRLYQQLVRKNELFTSISTHTTGSIDPGMLVISGRIKPGVTLEEAHEAVQAIVTDIARKGLEEEELERVKAQAESSLEFAEVEVLNRAINLAFATLSGDTSIVNQEAERIARVNADDIRRVASGVLRESNSTVMYYRSRRAQSEALKDAS